MEIQGIWQRAGLSDPPVPLPKYSKALPGVTIGEGAVIGASSVVNKDIPPWSIAVGSPAKVIGTRDKVTVPDI